MYKKIMVPLDGSDLAECVLPHVKAVTKGFEPGKIFLVRVVEPFPPSYHAGDAVDPELIEKSEANRRASAKEYIDGIAAKLKQEGAPVHPEVIVGRTTESLVDFAEKNGVDLLVIASHGRSGLSRWVMGSVADRLLRSANVPILIIRPAGAKCEV